MPVRLGFIFTLGVSGMQNVLQNPLGGLVFASEFDRYLTRFGKHYEETDWAKHYNVFIEDHQFVTKENKQQQQYEVELNYFADIPWEDVRGHYFGIQGTPEKLIGSKPHAPSHSIRLDSALRVDWAARGAVTPAKYQGVCGSCWSFSSSGALEGAYQIATGYLVNLSEQELVNGTNGMDDNHGCNGGWMFTAFDFVREKGLATEESVPYTSGKSGGDGPELDLPNANIGIAPGVVLGYQWVTQDKISMLTAISSQPVSVTIEVSSLSFMLYSKGVLSQPECGSSVNHAMLATGYEQKNEPFFWVLKNSWGVDWGEKGFIKLQMNSDQTYDACGILAYAFYPVLSPFLETCTAQS